MNKNILYLGLGLGGAAIAYLAYRFMQTPSQTYTTTTMNPYSNPTGVAVNENTYPFQPVVQPRMDNSNQPWAANNRGAISQVSAPQINTGLNDIASYVKDISTISQGLTSIWEDFGIGDWFSSGDSDIFMADDDYSFFDDGEYV